MNISKRLKRGIEPANLMQRRSFLAAVGPAIIASNLGRARAEKDADKPQDAATSLKAMGKVARWVTISELTEGVAATPAECQAEPLFRFNNPRVHDATLWRWGSKGRPVALLKVVKYGHEARVGNGGYRGLGVTALSPNTVKVRFPDGSTWQSRTPGVKLNPLPGMPEPAATDRQRLSQMKEALRRFAATMQLLPTDNPTHLRVLPTPLLRYDDRDSGLQDGALFSLSDGTSPALFLVLEIRADAGGDPTWHYGFGRTGGAIEVATLDGKQVYDQSFVTAPANVETYATRSIFLNASGEMD